MEHRHGEERSAAGARGRRLDAWLVPSSIFGIALGLRLVHLLEASRGPFGVAGYLPIDARTYHAWAIEWLAGAWPPAQPLFRPPLYTWFVGAVYAVAGPQPVAVKLVQAGLGAATALLAYGIGRELFADRRVAPLGAAIWAVCGTSIFFDAQLLPGSLDAFLQTALVWVLLVAGRSGRTTLWSAAGLLVGLSALHRGGVLIFLPCVLVWIFLPGGAGAARAPGARRWRAGLRAALALLVPAALLIAPVSWRNAVYDVPPDGPASPRETLRRLATGQFVAIAEASGVNFRLGNLAVLRELNVITHPDHFAVWDRMVAEPYQRGIRSTAEANRWIARETVSEIAARPGEWLGLMAEKAAQLVGGAEIPRNTSIYPDRADSRVLRWLLWKHGLAFPSGLIIPFGLSGIWLCRRAWRAHFVAWSCLATQSAFVLAFFVTARYRLPSLPLLALYAASAACEGVDRVRARRWPGVARLAGLLALLLLASNWRVGTMPSAHWPLEHFDLARVHLERGELREGEAQLRAALAIDPVHVKSNAQLCRVLVFAGRAEEGIRSCTRAAAAEPDAPDAHYYLGASLEASGRRPAAIEEYRTALRLEPGHAKAAAALEKALATGSPARRAPRRTTGGRRRPARCGCPRSPRSRARRPSR